MRCECGYEFEGAAFCAAWSKSCRSCTFCANKHKQEDESVVCPECGELLAEAGEQRP